MNELYQDIKDSGLYHVSILGEVWTCRIPKMQKQTYKDRWVVVGYKIGQYLGFKYRGQNVYLHRFIWWWFNGDIPEGWEVDHVDGDNSYNHPTNLDAVTKSENQQRKWNNNPQMKLSHSKIFTKRIFSPASIEKMRISAKNRKRSSYER